MKIDTHNYCLKTGKYSYSSEAKAMRALNRYDDIERFYICKGCDGWHTTSMDEGTAVKIGVIDPPKKKKRRDRKPTQNMIQQRLDNLNKEK